MKCPTCGAENDPANRFCDQCGTRLDAASAPAPAAQAAAAPQPAAGGPTCPHCGAAVVPGEAFCDNCGAPLGAASAPAPASAEAPTVAATPAATNGASGPVCPQCGAANAPGDRFCDNCGAALTTAADGATTISPAQSEPAAAPTPNAAPQPVGDAPSASAPPDAAAPTEDVAAQATPAEAAPAAEAPAPPLVDSQAPTSPDLGAQAAYETQRGQLEAEIGRQQQVVAQLESVQGALGAATPPGVLQSLDEARAALARTQADLDALQPPAPPADPAEVARLEGEIGRQQQVVAQLESVQGALGAATPPGVLQSLDEARAALARTQAELSALTGGAPAAPSSAPAPAASDASAATVEVPPLPAPPPQPAGPTDETVVAAPPVPETPAPSAPSAGARLVFEESGTEIVLPTDRAEIIIGREDPISGIHPEVDMTPYGGESGGVSRQHARISRDGGGQWMITDLNSTNYTRVDGVKLDPNVPTALQSGARIQLGRVSVTFRM